MVKLRMGVLVVLYIVTARGSDLKITDFVPPSYRGYGLKIYVDGGYDNGYQYDEYDCDIEIIPFYRIYGDTTEWNLTLDAWGSGRSSDYDYLTARTILCSDLRCYLFRSNAFAYGLIRPEYLLDRRFSSLGDYWIKRFSMDATFGTGIGRIREGQYIAIALRINQLLLEENIITDNLSDSTIYAIARLLSQEQKFSIDYNRFGKYLFREIEHVLTSDNAFQSSIPVYAWIEILEIASRYRYYDSDISYWQRKYGDRFGVYFHARNISESNSTLPRREFPLWSDYDYSPSLEFLFEHEQPLGLQKQFCFISAYRVYWDLQTIHHRFENTIGYEWGIIDKFLVGGFLSVDYFFDPDITFNMRHTLSIFPNIEYSYYLEDAVTLRLRTGLDFDIATNEIDQSDSYEMTIGPEISISTYWRIF
jgi:hypothetical protein